MDITVSIFVFILLTYKVVHINDNNPSRLINLYPCVFVYMRLWEGDKGLLAMKFTLIEFE